MARFVDSTGRQGPATWGVRPLSRRTGRSARDRRELVRGVRVCRVVGQVAADDLPLEPRRRSEHERRGRAAQQLSRTRADEGRCERRRMNRFGAFDLAGNVKEWCWNRSAGDKYFILGGGWDEPAYMFNDPDMRPPLERGANFGFRCVKYSDDDTVAKTGELVAFEARDFNRETPGVRSGLQRVPHALRLRSPRSRRAHRTHRRLEPRVARRKGVVQRGLWQRARAGLPVSCRNKRRLLTNGRVLPRIPSADAAVQRWPGHARFRLGHEVGSSPRLSHLQEHVRAGRRDRERRPGHDHHVPRPRHLLGEGRAADAGLSGVPAGHRS